MGVYFNPKNESYTRARNSRIFIDKTGLIEYLNQRLSSEENCISLSHARRFGKSHAAGMIDAYYSRGCDSSKLFDDTKIAESADYRKYMNQYNVMNVSVVSKTVSEISKIANVVDASVEISHSSKQISTDMAQITGQLMDPVKSGQ